MPSWAYLLFNVGTFCSAVWLMRQFSVQLRFKALALAYLLVSVPSVLWDMWAVSEGHWGFNGRFVLGLDFFGIAFEEVLFFVTVPLVCLVIYQAMTARNSRALRKPIVGIVAVGLLGLLGLVMATAWVEQGYTRSVGLALLLSSLVLLWHKKLIIRQSFWQFQVVLFGLFLAANTFLTAMPVITYGALDYIGFRVGTIPLEDFAYNFALINCFILVYEFFDKKH